MNELADALGSVPLIGIVRTSRGGLAEGAAAALLRGGIRAVEIALTSPDALEAVAAVAARRRPDALIGAGSVRTAADARAAIDAGASFLVTPLCAPEVLAAASPVPVVCGAFTPTEIDLAQRAGAAYVKVFPADGLGPRYLRSVLTPMPELRLVPTGGVSLDNLQDWFRSGAAAVAVGGELVPRDLPEPVDWAVIERRARDYATAAVRARDDALG